MVAATIGEPLSETGDGDLKYMNVISVVFWPPHFGEHMPVGDDLARALRAKTASTATSSCNERR